MLAKYIISASHRSPAWNTGVVPGAVGHQTQALSRGGGLTMYDVAAVGFRAIWCDVGCLFQKLFPCVSASVRLQRGEVVWLQSPPEITVCQSPRETFGHDGVSSYRG